MKVGDLIKEKTGTKSMPACFGVVIAGPEIVNKRDGKSYDTYWKILFSDNDIARISESSLELIQRRT